MCRCIPFDNADIQAGFFTDKTVLIQRGACEFALKASITHMPVRSMAMRVAPLHGHEGGPTP